MTQAEQDEVKARVEKLVGEFAKKIGGLEEKVTQLEDEIQRKNEALEGFMAENEALKDELGGRPPRRALKPAPGPQCLPVRPAVKEDLEAKLHRWKKEARS